MADARHFFLISCSVILLLPFGIFCSSIPVLAWSSSRSFTDLPEVHAGHTIKAADFQKHYVEEIVKNPDQLVVIFTQNKLGLQDLARHADIYDSNGHGGAFHNVKRFLDENFSLQLPAVKKPMETIGRVLSEFTGHVTQLVEPYDLSSVDFSTTRVLMVSLPHIQAANEKSSFTHNDELISKVITQLGTRKYIAIYTAQSHRQTDDETLTFQGRQLLAVNAENDTWIYVNTTDCVLLYTRGIKLTTYNFTTAKGKKIIDKLKGTVILSNPTSAEGSCDKETGNSIVMTFAPGKQNGSDLSSAKLEFGFAKEKYGDWYIANATFTYSGTLAGDKPEEDIREVKLDVGRSFSLDRSAYWAPRDMAYHCTQPEPFSEFLNSNESDSSVVVKITFQKLEVQGFGVKGDKFGIVYDCVPFFTGVIWTGLLSVAVLLIILFFGLSMISDIKTMKNFDDPKGKQLLVQTDD